MMWKAIASSVIGTAHIQSGKNCEDANCFSVVTTAEGEEILICCVSDGAGSALFAQEASTFATAETVKAVAAIVAQGKEIDENAIFVILENIYDCLAGLATQRQVPLNEFSCTYLSCIIMEEKAMFFQVGDGAIIRDDGNGNFTTVFWPQNGEYSNTTSFLVDDSNFPFLKKSVLNERIREVALLTDGLQLLILNNETSSVHQPFFNELFKWLRMARQPDDVAILQKKLNEYLGSETINTRTDDDKTLFLATRISK